ncbi:hypothetical protein [Flavobacterium enshiense]|uniref:Uncharacterized protein n=1 Tax=Flavobacterium enshiense DK69 TaxID=1107311 RepID=A0A0A2N1V9_9FLAO|nr:hypothetical protein [Flavobacterium enshiense]KGO94445.1 hypothetical protein Q767_12800 [Flavobacterium enshiense DK69]
MPHNKLLYLTTFGVGFLAVGLITVSFKLYDFSLKNKELKDKISLEKSIHQNQISEILKRYDSVNEKYSNNVSDVKVSASPKSVSISAEKNNKVVVKTNPEILVKKLSAVNVSARGVRIISNDVVETTVSSKIDQVRVRFTLEENKDVKPGNKTIFIQVVNPKNRLLTLKGGGETQLVKEIYYDRLNTDACVFIDLYQYQLIVGDYKIRLINEGQIIGTANFRVN